MFKPNGGCVHITKQYIRYFICMYIVCIRGGSRGVSVVPRNYSDSLKFISSLKFYIMHITNSAILYNARCMSICQPGCKKSARPIRSHNGYKRPKSLISSKAKKLNILLRILLLESVTYNSLQGIFTTMIGFVTWPPFCTIIFYKVAK